MTEVLLLVAAICFGILALITWLASALTAPVARRVRTAPPRSLCCDQCGRMIVRTSADNWLCAYCDRWWTGEPDA